MLSGQSTCKRRPNVDIFESSKNVVRAGAQRQIVMRILMGEPIDDIAAELDSILNDKNYRWETATQKRQSLALWTARIKKMTDWQLGNNELPDIPQEPSENATPEQIAEYDAALKEYDEVTNRRMEAVDKMYFPDFDDEAEKERFTINYHGEDILVQPDYIYQEPNSNVVYMCRVKTSVFNSEKKDVTTGETEALGLLGEKLYPGKEIHVRYLHLGRKKENPENFIKDYDDTSKQDIQAISEAIWDDKTKEALNSLYEQEKDHVCSGADCAGCAMYNVCNFEEPPISIDVQAQVRPRGDIRLSADQQAVVDFRQGIARVNAGAGAGKTTVVSVRVAELIKEGVQPEDICLVTFTKAGAEEMAARVSAYCAEEGLLVDPLKLRISTFNAYCGDLISEHYQELNFTAPPRIIPDATKTGIINEILDRYPEVKEWNYGSFSDLEATYGGAGRYSNKATDKLKTIFAEIKKEGYTLENNPYRDTPLDRSGKTYTAESINAIFQMYDAFQAEMMHRNMIEFDDQINLVFELLEMHPTLMDEEGFKHIIVDEFQDTDYPQIQLLQRMINNANFVSFMAVGDDSQAIFGFRHTSPKYMINFGEYFGQGFRDFHLIENHRSQKLIIDNANNINGLSENKLDKDLIATKPAGTPVEMKAFYTQKQEYTWIAQQIKARMDRGEALSSIAFLGRDKNQLQAMATALTELGVPSILCNPIPYVKNSRVAALCSFYKAFKEGSTKGFMDYQNVMLHGNMRGMSGEEIESVIENFREDVQSSPKTLSTFKEYMKTLDENEVDVEYQAFLEEMEYVQSMDELDEFFQSFELYGQKSTFKREGKYEGVCLTTVHSAKGLEWDTVYTSLSNYDKEGYHKDENKFRQNGELDENYRLWFVAASRARNYFCQTGQYVLSAKNESVVLNDYTLKAQQLLGMPNEFSLPEFNKANIEEEKEHAKNAKEAIESIGIHGRKKGGVSKGGKGRLLTDAMEIAEAIAREKQKHGGKAALASEPEILKATKRYNKAKAEREGTREMTPEEIAEYEKLAAGAKQMDITEFIDAPEKKETKAPAKKPGGSSVLAALAAKKNRQPVQEEIVIDEPETEVKAETETDAEADNEIEIEID